MDASAATIDRLAIALRASEERVGEARRFSVGSNLSSAHLAFSHAVTAGAVLLRAASRLAEPDAKLPSKDAPAQAETDLSRGYFALGLGDEVIGEGDRLFRYAEESAFSASRSPAPAPVQEALAWAAAVRSAFVCKFAHRIQH